MLEHEIPLTTLERETYWFLSRGLREITQKFGAKNLFCPNEVVLFTREAGLSGDLTIVADNRPDHFFVAVCNGHYLPSPSKLYGGGYYLSQAEGQNLSLYLMRASLSRLPFSGRVILWDKEVSLDKTTAIFKEINDAPPDKMASLPKYFVPRNYVVGMEFENGDDFFVLPRGMNWGEALTLFNRPELLFPRQDPYSGEVIGLILECEQEHFEQRERILNDIMIERGLDRKDLIQIALGKKSAETLKEISAEIEHRMGQSGIIAA